MPKAFLGLGSNLGDRRGSLLRAVREITRLGPRPTAISSIYRSAPEEFSDQPDFLNQVLQVETELPPEELLSVCLEVEARMGRRRGFPKGPRNIDVDLLLYGLEVRTTPDLTLPHPSLHRRRFVLEPLCEICPEAPHPLLGRTAGEILRDLGPAGGPLPRVGPGELPAGERSAGRPGG